MIFNKDLLFLHVPKAGGMAVTKYLLEVLPRPVYYMYPDYDPLLEASGVIQIKGIRHETMEEARTVVHKYGLGMNQFKSIIAVVRNPYLMELSRFAYLQKGHPWDRGRNQDLALQGDFERFAIQSSNHGGTERPIQSYFLLGGRLPANLKILRAENLESEFKHVLQALGVGTDRPLLRDNESQHEEPLRYYTRAAEEAVFRRYQWIFDSAFYPRLAPESLPSTIEYPISGPCVPLIGSVRQIGVSSGLWEDSWVGRQLCFHVRALDAVRTFIVEGAFPRAYRKHVDLTLHLNGARMTRRISTEGRNTAFRLECEFDLPARDIGRIEVAPSDCWCPRQEIDSPDDRQLSFQLSQLIFIGNSK